MGTGFRPLVALAAALAIAGCGSSERPAPTPAPRTDDAFVVRIARHQQTALALAHSAAKQAESASVRRLARRIATGREQAMPAFMEQLAHVEPDRKQPDRLGVSPEQAAESIQPDALEGAQPVDAAFLNLMTRHNEGGIALAQAEIDHGSDPAVKALAQRVAAESTGELARLSRALVALAQRS